jgi:predicted dehydrogenase
MRTGTRTKSALLIGAGKIGAGYDSVATYYGPSLSHLRALQQSVNVEYIDIVDLDERSLAEVRGRPKVRKCCNTLEKQLLIDSDVIVIASPTSTHADLLSLISGTNTSDGPIICEKPTSSSETDLVVVDSLPSQFKNRIFVNYSRQWSTDHIKIGKLISSGKLGALKFVRCLYDKGILNNGVHLIDILKTLLGNQIDLNWIGNPIFDNGPENPTLSFQITFGSVPVFVIGNDARNYSIFEMKFFFEGGTIELMDSGRELVEEQTKSHSIYPDYTVLEQTTRRTTDLTHAMDKMYQEILGEKADSNLQNAIDTERFCLQILRSHKNGQGQQ